MSILSTFGPNAQKRGIIAPPGRSLSIFPSAGPRTAGFLAPAARPVLIAAQLSEECHLGGAHTWHTWHPWVFRPASGPFIRNNANSLALLAVFPRAARYGRSVWAPDDSRDSHRNSHPATTTPKTAPATTSLT